MKWLDGQSCDLVRYWVRHTESPMVVTHPDGKIYAANRAFCDKVSYTEIELTRDGMTWMLLTPRDEDLDADVELANRLKTGEITDYTLRKHLVPKGSAQVPVIIHVLRWPIQGEIICCLVTAYFVADSNQVLHNAMVKSHMEMEKAVEKLTSTVGEKLTKLTEDVLRFQSQTELDQFVLASTRLWSKYPKLVGTILLTLITALTGQTIIQALSKVIPALSGLQQIESRSP